MSPRQQAEVTLIEAFPSIDAKVVKAVLTASGGQVEPAFNALLGKQIPFSDNELQLTVGNSGMSDPDFQAETPPPKPPRPTAAQRQLAQDEQYARQLASQYQERTDRQGSRGPPQQQQQQQQSRRAPGEKDYREYNFFDGMLPDSNPACCNTLLKSTSYRRAPGDPREPSSRLPTNTDHSQQMDLELPQASRWRGRRGRPGCWSRDRRAPSELWSIIDRADSRHITEWRLKQNKTQYRPGPLRC